MTEENKKTLFAGVFFAVALTASLYLYRANAPRGVPEAQIAKALHYRNVSSYRRGRTLTAQTAKVANEYLALKAAGKTGVEGEARFSPSFFREIDRVLAHPDPSGRYRDTLEADAFSALTGVGQYGTAADREQGMQRLRRLAVSPSRFYRLAAAPALHSYSSTEANVLLERLTHDPDPQVAAFAAEFHDPAQKVDHP
jgi:hypothetical protein